VNALSRQRDRDLFLHQARERKEDVMKTILFTAALSAAVLAGLGNFGIRAQDLPGQQNSPQADEQNSPQAGVFDKWLKPDAPECVPVSAIQSVSHLTKLNPQQFQFVRALYIAIPPISRQLPPGDSAVVAIADGKAMIALVADGQSCARFLAPDFILSMLVQVGKGENGTVGEAI
jgi:hypothetical protein